VASRVTVLCSSCGGRLARDNTGTVCSPCKRTHIETSAQRAALVTKDGPRIKAMFESSGLQGVARHLDCTPDEALDVLLNAQLLPFVSAERRAVLHRLVGMPAASHVAAGESLGISRWTVATYRRQLGIVRSSAAPTTPTSGS
jgi:hypothetical protein